jgi:Na+/H+ antiporter NhaD/arsenite permease-like protein
MDIKLILLLSSVVFFFFLMVRNRLSQEVAVPLLAMTAMIIAGPAAADDALSHGVSEFGRVAIIFTAVAVAARQLLDSNVLKKYGRYLGEIIGEVSLKTTIPLWVLVPTFSLFTVYITAALFHNTTSILVCVPLIYLVCQEYKISPRYVLCGALVASNLGGFSTRWGDTPNLIEAKTWALAPADFFMQIMPVNIGFMILLCGIVIWLIERNWKKDEKKTTPFEWTLIKEKFFEARAQVVVDYHLSYVGYAGLTIAIGTSILWPHYEVLGAAAAIIFCIVFDSRVREETLQALGIKTYLVIFSIFILARILSQSSLSVYLKDFIADGGMASIVLTSYFGTMLTEAASWAAAASPMVYEHSQTHLAAWALGGGICAGSSSALTAATAGILLTQVTKDCSKDEAISFSSYFWFGLGVSLLMLGYYIGVFAALNYFGLVE